jgi:hypothetical protein
MLGALWNVGQNRRSSTADDAWFTAGAPFENDRRPSSWVAVNKYLQALSSAATASKGGVYRLTTGIYETPDGVGLTAGGCRPGLTGLRLAATAGGEPRIQSLGLARRGEALAAI